MFNKWENVVVWERSSIRQGECGYVIQSKKDKTCVAFDDANDWIQNDFLSIDDSEPEWAIQSRLAKWLVDTIPGRAVVGIVLTIVCVSVIVWVFAAIPNKSDTDKYAELDNRIHSINSSISKEYKFQEMTNWELKKSIQRVINYNTEKLELEKVKLEFVK